VPSADLCCPEVPSVGSIGHRTGSCKPCVFLHTKGCQSGLQCQFCHLCGPDEKKQRQKAKRLHFQQVRTTRANGSSQFLQQKDSDGVCPHSGTATPLGNDEIHADTADLHEVTTSLPVEIYHATSSSDLCSESSSTDRWQSYQAKRPSLLQMLGDHDENPYVVRNTFIETSFGMPTPLGGDCCDRASISCPAAKIGTMHLTVQTHFDDADVASLSTIDFASIAPETPQSFPGTPWPPTPEPSYAHATPLVGQMCFPATAIDATTDALAMPWQPSLSLEATMLQCAAAPSQGQFSTFPCLGMPVEPWPQMSMMAPLYEPTLTHIQFVAAPDNTFQDPDQTHAAGSRILTLAEVIEFPVQMKTQSETPNVDMLPSLGSIGHSVGNCKPCGFLHKAGCGSGAQCNYCHICEPGEKKRRQREKRETLRDAARLKDRRAASGGA